MPTATPFTEGELIAGGRGDLGNKGGGGERFFLNPPFDSILLAGDRLPRLETDEAEGAEGEEPREGG